MNLAGGLMLFYSFQATSSSFRLIKRQISSTGLFRNEYEYDICVEDYTLLLSDPATGGMGLGHRGCPKTPDDKPAAVVNTEHPFLVTLGFVAIIIGFSIQFFSVPEPRTMAQLRHEIKMLRKQQELEKLRGQ